MVLYDAFISYSHLKDKPIAAALQSAIQKLGKPWYRRRTLRLFRDDTSLSATPYLWPMIEQALGQSRHFLLLASPEAAASKWVDKEVAYWLEHNSIDTLLVGLTDGDLIWDDAAGDFTAHGDAGIPLPPALAKRFPSESKWVDLRPYRAGADKRDARFTELAADFAAAIRGMPKEDLLSQEVRQQRRALTLAWSAAASLLILATAASVAGVLAYRAQQEAERTLAVATDTANSLVRDLAVRLRSVTSIPSTLVKDILDRARKLQEQLISQGEDSPELRRSQSRALNETAATLVDIGEYSAALATAQQAKAILQRLITAQPDVIEFQRALASSDQKIGDALRGLGRFDAALASYRDDRAILQTLVAKDQGNSQFQKELANVDDDIGATLDSQRNFHDAVAAFSAGLTIRKQLVISDPSNVDYQIDLAGSYENIGISLASAGKQDDGLAALRQGLTSAQAVVAKQPDNSVAQVLLLGVEVNLGTMSAVWGNYADALRYCNDVIARDGRLTQGDPLNFNWQGTSEECQLTVGDAQSSQNRFADALSSYKDAQARADHMLESDSGSFIWQRYLLTSIEGSGKAQIGLRDFAGAEKSYTDALTLIQKMLKRTATDLKLQYKLAATHQKLAQAYTATRRPTDALNALRQAQTIMVRLTTLAPNNTEWKSDLDEIEAQIASSQK